MLVSFIRSSLVLLLLVLSPAQRFWLPPNLPLMIICNARTTSPCVIRSRALPSTTGGRNRCSPTGRCSLVPSRPEVLERCRRRMLHLLQETMECTISSNLSGPRGRVFDAGKNVLRTRRTLWANLCSDLLRNRIRLANVMHIAGTDVHKLSHNQVLYDGFVLFRISLEDKHHPVMTRLGRMRSCPLGHLLDQVVLSPVDRGLRHDVFQVQSLMRCPHLSRFHR
mmetsp:Transcript_896/g.1952  ORF Transcript_896/g.1952 Transcript_896/m.1952 type:complete len:223 (+) Transcript_896:1465-2133(+)